MSFERLLFFAVDLRTQDLDFNKLPCQRPVPRSRSGGRSTTTLLEQGANGGASQSTQISETTELRSGKARLIAGAGASQSLTIMRSNPIKWRCVHGKALCTKNAEEPNFGEHHSLPAPDSSTRPCPKPV